jgi:hypothetical protein
VRGSSFALVVPTLLLLLILQLVCGTIQAAAMVSARRRLMERLAAELRERRRVEARINQRSAILRMMYGYPQPSGPAIIDPAMRITTDQRASIGRLIAYYVIVAAMAVVIFGLMR